MITNKLVNAIRFLSADAVEAAASGHPGMPLGMADIAEVLWRDHLRHSPKNPSWFNRDRFVLSNGHGSMLLYSVLYLAGYPDITLEDDHMVLIQGKTKQKYFYADPTVITQPPEKEIELPSKSVSKYVSSPIILASTILRP